MIVKQVAEKLNNKALNENFDIAKLPQLRKNHLGKKTLPNKIFTAQTIFEKDMYAFHNGGRTEMQFNFGEEKYNNKIYTRYGLCISIEPSRDLIDPVNALKPFKKKFNQCLDEKPEYFKGFKMWYHNGSEISKIITPIQISDKWFNLDNFIVLGGVINKSLKKLNENDLNEILVGFDKLLPIYKYCVLDNSSEINIKEKRIARICWNENDWIGPSGSYGKSGNKKAHENEKGYGHEEWLFDFEKTIDGFHYSLLQPAQKGRDTFLNKIFDVRLYSRNNETNEIVWVGFIKNLEVISIEVAAMAHQYYKELGWLNDMAMQIKKEGGDSNNLLNLEPHDCFNIRFKPENAKLFDPYRSLNNFEQLIGTYHYVFVKDQESSNKTTELLPKYEKRDFSFKSGKSEKDEIGKTIKRVKKTIQFKPIHDKLQNTLYEILVKKHGENKVGVETNTGNGTRIDVCVEAEGEITLYEIKSYSSVLTSIRVAVGQLIEYAYYPNPIENLKELIIVTHLPINVEDKEYLELIRNSLNLNIFYQSIDLESKVLSNKS